jgi:hypothetical protein
MSPRERRKAISRVLRRSNTFSHTDFRINMMGEVWAKMDADKNPNIPASERSGYRLVADDYRRMIDDDGSIREGW